MRHNIQGANEALRKRGGPLGIWTLLNKGSSLSLSLSLSPCPSIHVSCKAVQKGVRVLGMALFNGGGGLG